MLGKDHIPSLPPPTRSPSDEAGGTTSQKSLQIPYPQSGIFPPPLLSYCKNLLDYYTICTNLTYTPVNISLKLIEGVMGSVCVYIYTHIYIYLLSQDIPSTFLP